MASSMVREAPSSEAARKSLSPNCFRIAASRPSCSVSNIANRATPSLLPRGIGHAEKARCFTLITRFRRKVSEAFERIGNGHVAVRFGGNVQSQECVVGRLLELALRDRDTRSSSQRRHQV